MAHRVLDPIPKGGTRWGTRLGPALATALFAACVPVESQTPPAEKADVKLESQTPPPGNADVPVQSPALPPEEAVVPVMNLHSITGAALADATRLTGIERDKLVVVDAQAVTWRNGSLGCPQPGMAYTDALVPGYRVRIQAGEQMLDYHAGSRGGLTLCPEGRAVDPLPDDSRT